MPTALEEATADLRLAGAKLAAVADPDASTAASVTAITEYLARQQVDVPTLDAGDVNVPATIGDALFAAQMIAVSDVTATPLIRHMSGVLNGSLDAFRIMNPDEDPIMAPPEQIEIVADAPAAAEEPAPVAAAPAPEPAVVPAPVVAAAAAPAAVPAAPVNDTPYCVIVEISAADEAARPAAIDRGLLTGPMIQSLGRTGVQATEENFTLTFDANTVSMRIEGQTTAGNAAQIRQMFGTAQTVQQQIAGLGNCSVTGRLG